MTTTTLGVFKERQSAEKAISDLKDKGVDTESISIVYSGDEEAKAVQETAEDAEEAKDTAEGAAAGGVIGAIAGITLAAIVIPGLGGLIAGGPLAAAMGVGSAAAATAAGATTGAAIGGLVGALVGMGAKKEEAESYAEAVRQGNVLIAVTTDMTGIDDVFKSHGASMVKQYEEEREKVTT